MFIIIQKSSYLIFITIDRYKATYKYFIVWRTRQVLDIM